MHEVSNMPVDTNPIDTNPTIFLIEEDDNARPVFKKHLRRQGYRVLVAADFEDALIWLETTHVPADLVVINLVRKTPEEALEIGRKLREHAKYDGQTPLVVMPEKIHVGFTRTFDNERF
jgi:DNA-binding response OmpR family regulator